MNKADSPNEETANEPHVQDEDLTGEGEDDEEDEPLSDIEHDQEDDDNDSIDGAPDPEPFVEPSYENFSSVPFSIISKALENICKARAVKKNKTLKDYLCKLLPPRMLDKLSQPKPAANDAKPQPQSIYPLMRIICPDVDNRRLQVKHRMLAIAYIEAFGWNRDTKKEAKMLLGFNDPHILASNANAAKCAGDFSGILFHVLDGRVPNKPSNLTVGQMNEILDDLAAIASLRSKGRGAHKTNHDWRDESSQQTTASPRKKRRKEPTLFQLRSNWMKRMLPGGDRSMSALEHKWLARIILSEMKYGIGFEKLLAWYHPDGPALFSGHNSLRAVCNKLCQPGMRRLLAERQQSHMDKKSKNVAFKTPPSLRKRMALVQVQLGNQFTPMFSSRTGFDRLLTDISKRHRDFVKNPDDGQYDRPALHSLAITHPAFSVETKLDGERMLVHYFHQTEIVKIHSRSSKWYSNLYSPVLGPTIRRAFAHLDCDLILDGEVLAWDDGNEENIPFGNNRTVAKLRHDWMNAQGLLDQRDCNLHANENDGIVVREAYNWDAVGDRVADLAGKECWITFVAFDVVYIGGQGAQTLIDSTIAPYLVGEVKPGSLVELEAMERKKLLYRILERDIPNKLEKVMTKIIRPTGEMVDAEDYFSFQNPLQEHGYPCHLLDSITAAFQCHVPNLSEIDKLRRGNLSDEEISLKRASAINRQYTHIVDEKLLEGLIFKDLSSCYILDKESRSYAFWLKFKPDYFNGSVASDLDLVIVGGYFATGLRHSGRPSSFLCACLDPNDDDLFWPVVKVNAGSVNLTELNKIFERTGFQKAWENKQMELGSWVRDDGKHIPDFIAQKSDGPWKPSKKDRPSLWIDPRHVCLVLQLNAGEITESPSFDLGLTLRFPRITRVRYDKRHTDVENTATLSDIFMKVETNRAKSANAFAHTSPDVTTSKYARFKTEKQFEQGKKNRKGSRRVKVKAKIAPNPQKVESRCLENLSFCVLDSNSFCLQAMDEEEAESEGWLEYIKDVKSKYDVQAFIKRHGGKVILAPDFECHVLGCRPQDIRVRGFIDSIEHARMQPKPKGKNPTQKSIRYAKQAQLEGVLRWTFPFRLVAKWNSLPEGCRQDTVQASLPEECRPNILDYIARTTSSHSIFRELGNINSIFMMRRALELEGSESIHSNLNWCDSLETEDKLFLTNERHRSSWFPSSTNGPQMNKPLIFLFSSGVNNGFFDCVASVLPLLETHQFGWADSLSQSVTHVVCDLHAKKDWIEYKTETGIDPHQYFVNPKHGEYLLEKLESLRQNSSGQFELGFDHPVYLVSPFWIRKRCEECLS